jgi:hypothetical protein
MVHSIWLEIGPDATNELVVTAPSIVSNWLIGNETSFCGLLRAADRVSDEDACD